jgi:anti-sigma factor RsiW
MILSAPPLVCREAVEFMSDYLDGSMRRRDRKRLERHLENCDTCREYLEQLREVVAATGRVEVEELPPETLDGLVEIFRQLRSGGSHVVLATPPPSMAEDRTSSLHFSSWGCLQSRWLRTCCGRICWFFCALGTDLRAGCYHDAVTTV